MMTVMPLIIRALKNQKEPYKKGEKNYKCKKNRYYPDEKTKINKICSNTKVCTGVLRTLAVT